MNARQHHLQVKDLLEHIEEAAALASGYVSDLSKTAFLKDRKTQQAVIYNILIIGEAATQILNQYPEFTETHPEIPWREMRGMRNRMAHGYFQLDMEIIWDTATQYIGKLYQQIASLK